MKKYISKIKLFLFSIVLFLIPFISSAQNIFRQNSNSRYGGFGSNYNSFGTRYGGLGSNYAYGSGSTITDIIFFMINLINQAVVLVVALALLLFFWGVANFIFNADNEDKRTEGKKVMMWGIIALFVMLFVWQIVNILANTFF